MRQIEIGIDCGGAKKQNALKPSKVMANASSKYMYILTMILFCRILTCYVFVFTICTRELIGDTTFSLLDSKRLNLFMVGERIRAARVSVHAGKRISEIMHFNKIYVERFSSLFSFSVDNLDKLLLF